MPKAMSVSELQRRRRALMQALPANSVVLLKGSGLVIRSNDTEYPFRQSSDFFYLTALNEPDAWLCITKSAKGAIRETLFVLPRDHEQEIWHGRRLGAEAAQALTGIAHVYDSRDLNKRVMQVIGQHSNLVWPLQCDADELALRQRWLDHVTTARNLNAPRQHIDLNPYVHELRLIKSDAEIALMRQSTAIAVAAHRRAMQSCKPGMYEYQVAANIHHEFAFQGAAGPAYGTICGSGNNACILHYTENSSQMRAGDLLLIDAGCEYQGYASDITRTFPVDGRFTPMQARLYQWVLKAHRAAIALIKPGNTLPQAYKVAAHILTEGLIDLGVLKGSVAENVKAVAYRPFFMHGLGHWLGLDVHDVGEYKQSGDPRPLKAGMVLTIEPGLYIPTDTDCHPELRGVGVRIEDDILVTAAGHDNLTAAVPVEIDAIEALMAGQS